MPRVDQHSFYSTVLEVYGTTARGVRWNSADSQQIRFQILRQLLPEDLSALTLVDAGCGFGDLYLFLKKETQLPARYIGLDILPTMIDTARERVDREILECDVLRDALPKADYYLCSGAMNNLTRDETHLFVERCLAASAKGFVFNLLKGQEDGSLYNLFLPEEIRDLARTLGADCEIVEGYLPHDLSAALRKSSGG